MKLQLDTEKKTITLSENVKLEDLVNLLTQLLPDDKWKEYTLETSTIVNWSPNIIPQPTILPWTEVIRTPLPYHEGDILPYPRRYPWITCDVKPGYSNLYSISKGIYNIELKDE